jgi:xanthine dehydrogenase YagS FAD-binding subunit
MRTFEFERANTVVQALKMGSGTGQGETDAATQFLAGGTTLVDLMKLDVLKPRRVVDLGPLRKSYDAIQTGTDGLRLGAFAKMSVVADHPIVVSEYPALAQSLQLAASSQLRNMATLGGNVLQKTRCTYYRDPGWTACNKRTPHSGCAALAGFNRNHAILGVEDSCIAQYPGDFGVALIAFEAQVDLIGPLGQRQIPFASLHSIAQGAPHIENTLKEGEIITQFHIPFRPYTRRSIYVKVRDRASYEFAISSAAVALELDGDQVREARVGLGGMAYRPWRSLEAERALAGKPLTDANAAMAADAALTGAKTHGFNDYKPELARRTIVRALMEAKALSLPRGAGV